MKPSVSVPKRGQNPWNSLKKCTSLLPFKCEHFPKYSSQGSTLKISSLKHSTFLCITSRSLTQILPFFRCLYFSLLCISVLRFHRHLEFCRLLCKLFSFSNFAFLMVLPSRIKSPDPFLVPFLLLPFSYQSV